MRPVILLAFANDRDEYLPTLKREGKNVYKSLQRLHDYEYIEILKEDSASLMKVLVKAVSEFHSEPDPLSLLDAQTVSKETRRIWDRTINRFPDPMVSLLRAVLAQKQMGVERLQLLVNTYNLTIQLICFIDLLYPAVSIVRPIQRGPGTAHT